MTGNDDGKIVRGASSCHGTYGSRRADPLRNLSIGPRGADRNLLQRLPDALLERSAANVQGKIQADARRLDETDYPSYQSLVVMIRADQMRPRKAILQVANKIVRIVSEKDCGHALLARSDKNGAKRRLANRELDLLVRPARTVL